MSTRNDFRKLIIGRSERINFVDLNIHGVPAKIDTGADSSAVWATKIHVDKDGILKFALFGEGSPFYNGKILKRTDYSVVKVRSTTGHEQIRYRTHFSVTIAGKKVKILMNLSDRSKMQFPVLIGRRSVSGKFLVDVSKRAIKIEKVFNVEQLNKELSKNPYEFYKKYHQKGVE